MPGSNSDQGQSQGTQAQGITAKKIASLGFALEEDRQMCMKLHSAHLAKTHPSGVSRSEACSTADTYEAARNPLVRACDGVRCGTLPCPLMRLPFKESISTDLVVPDYKSNKNFLLKMRTTYKHTKVTVSQPRRLS